MRVPVSVVKESARILLTKETPITTLGLRDDDEYREAGDTCSLIDRPRLISPLPALTLSLAAAIQASLR